MSERADIYSVYSYDAAPNQRSKGQINDSQHQGMPTDLGAGNIGAGMGIDGERFNCSAIIAEKLAAAEPFQ